MTSREILIGPALREFRPTDSTVQRFWSKVQVLTEDDCWPYMAARDPKGYGVFATSKHDVGFAHRFSFNVSHPNDPLVNDECALHSCDNPPCVNPAHLWRGTRADNNKDMASKKRSTRGTKNPNSKFTEDQVKKVVELSLTGKAQKDIAEYLGMSRPTVSNILRGKLWNSVTKIDH